MSSHKNDSNRHIPMQKMMMHTMPISNQRLAEATVPYQIYRTIWDPQTALRAGTIFPELYRPYPAK